MNQTKNITVQDDVIVSIDYLLKVDGQVFDQSEPGYPIEFLQGHANIVRGLERAIYGMRVGESKEVFVSPLDGYGEIDEEAYAEIPVEEFPEDMPLEAGIQLMLVDEEGDEQEAYITDVDDEMVYLSLNHPLAGKELYFNVTVVDIRQATPEELAHGHVHHEGDEENEDEYEDEEYEE